MAAKEHTPNLSESDHLIGILMKYLSATQKTISG